MAKDSACLPGYTSIGIHSNHMNMAKFAKNDDPGVVAVCGQLRRWLECVRRPATPSPAERPTVVNQYGHENRQYTLFGEGTMKIAGGNFIEVRGNHNSPMNDASVQPPPPYSD